jgi:hypothetical protein
MDRGYEPIGIGLRLRCGSMTARERACWGLAEELVWKANQLDPGALPDWSELDERARRFYYHLAKHLVLQHDLIQTAISEE